MNIFFSAPQFLSARVSMNTCSRRGLDATLILTHSGADRTRRILRMVPKAAIANPDSAKPNAAVEDPSHHTLTLETDPVVLHYQEDIRRFLASGPSPAAGFDRRQLFTPVGKVKKFVEAFVVNDKSRYVLFGGTPANRPALAAHATGVMNDVNAVYLAEDSDQFAYDFRVVLIGQHTFAGDDPWEGSVTMKDAETDCSR